MADIRERIVYKLVRSDKEEDGTDIYIGSTSIPLKQRLAVHRCDAKKVRNENNKLYKRMREVGVDNWGITPLLSQMCDKKTSRELERGKCSELNADLNTRTSIITPDERRQQKADYYEKNKEVILKYAVDYREKNKQKKKYHCAICEVACCSNFDLQRHLGTLKHTYAYMNSQD